MFMGPAAFCYYFPVVERYLYNVDAQSESQSIPAWILAQGFIMQLKNKSVSSNALLLKRLSELTDFVLKNVARYDESPAEHTRILQAWTELKEQLSERKSTH